MSFRFPFLLAPHLVQREILNICKPQEILIFSFCSKKAYKLVKVHRKKTEKGELVVVEGGFSRLLIRYELETVQQENESTTVDGIPINRLIQFCDLSDMPDETKTINICDMKIPAKFDPEDVLTTFWQDRVHGIKTVAEYIMRLFNMNIDLLHISNSSLWMIDWINSLQESYKRAIIFGCRPIPIDEHLGYILTNCKATEELSLRTRASVDARYTGQFRNYNVLRIQQGPWVTLDNLKAMDSINIHLGDSSLTSSDMNAFLKHWLAGGNSRLSFMEVELLNTDFDKVFQDLTEMIARVPEKRQFKLLDGSVEEFSNAYDIQRNDGVKASVLLSDQWNLSIFVWPADE